MAKLVLRPIYKEVHNMRLALKARAKEYKKIDYFEVEVYIEGEVFTSYITQFAFFYENQELEHEYEIDYPLKDFTNGALFEAPLINEKDIPNNVILAFEYALIKYYRKVNGHNDYFNQANSVSINLLFQKGLDLKFNSHDILKYKISTNSNTHDVIADLNSLAAKGVKLRLDGNRSLDSSVLESILYNLEPKTIDAIEYIEEPFSDLGLWAQSLWSDRIALALDESFEFQFRKNIPEEVNHIILKFGVNISVFEFFQLRRDKRNWQIIVTSGLECPQLFNFVIHLAALENNSAGLSTFNFYQNGLKLFKEFQPEKSLLIARPL
ncbi:hypothetical protein [Bacteriovorax sp. BAL6_X]|uniref:hypothetical protein n=1 Tax=Bacteriovorax sp. BAL6_X TaxID=1201290 RepID=UPI00058C92EC|nr:hypothetical protein [Bacteriovorax sp. BAL6_X]